MARMGMEMMDNMDSVAKAGGADSFYHLGLKYSAGKGVEADLIEAHKWFNLAAMRGNREARDYRSELAGEMSSGEIAEAQRQAREWLKTH